MICEAILLSLTVLSCWIGAVGMWRMQEPMQSLHYLSVPATLGSMTVTVAILLANGVDQAFWKMLLISLLLLAANSIVSHASARAFRTRELGHWEPRNGDGVEFVKEVKENDRS